MLKYSATAKRWAVSNTTGASNAESGETEHIDLSQNNREGGRGGGAMASQKTICEPPCFDTNPAKSQAPDTFYSNSRHSRPTTRLNSCRALGHRAQKKNTWKRRVTTPTQCCAYALNYNATMFWHSTSCSVSVNMKHSLFNMTQYMLVCCNVAHRLDIVLLHEVPHIGRHQGWGPGFGVSILKLRVIHNKHIVLHESRATKEGNRESKRVWCHQALTKEVLHQQRKRRSLKASTPEDARQNWARMMSVLHAFDEKIHPSKLA